MAPALGNSSHTTQKITTLHVAAPQELFLALVSTIRAFLPTPARALNASRRPAFVATVEGVGRMLALKAQNHMATLNKLERAKVRFGPFVGGEG